MVRIERCIDKDCKGYGKEFVDRGYGYPVCPSNRPTLSPRPMNPKFYGQYKEDTPDKKIHYADERGFKTLCGLKIIHNMAIGFNSYQVTCKRCKKVKL